ncbi:hypothetical protein GQX74_007239 [Glossina fuscipes]|nr:hypothetical protein GQX74_007239 [Glossina fuscipes]
MDRMFVLILLLAIAFTFGLRFTDVLAVVIVILNFLPALVFTLFSAAVLYLVCRQLNCSAESMTEITIWLLYALIAGCLLMVIASAAIAMRLKYNVDIIDIDKK